MNLAAWLDRAGRSRSDLPAIAFDGQVVCTYGDFAKRAATLAGALTAKCGLQAGDRVAIVSKNSTDYLEILYGIWWAGLVAVPVNAKLHGAEIGWILENAEARVVFASADVAEAVNAHQPQGLKELIEVGSSDYQRLFDGDTIAVAERAPDDLAWLFYTSGTTGRPKGAMLTHRNLAVAMSYGYLIDVDPCEPGNTLLVHGAPHQPRIRHVHHGPCLPHGGVNAVPASGGFEPDEILRLFARHGREPPCSPRRP